MGPTTRQPAARHAGAQATAEHREKGSQGHKEHKLEIKEELLRACPGPGRLTVASFSRYRFVFFLANWCVAPIGITGVATLVSYFLAGHDVLRQLFKVGVISQHVERNDHVDQCHHPTAAE